MLDLVGQGATVVAPRHAYNGTRACSWPTSRRAAGSTRRLVDITDTDAVVAACDDAALVWLESPTNPALEIADIETDRGGRARAPAPTSSSTTPSPLPCCQRRSTLGADLVVHSATKYLAGHSDAVLGAVVTRDDELYDVLKGRRDLVGAIPGTLEAWLALRGLRTLHLRRRAGRRPTPRSSSRRLARAPGASARSATPASAAIVSIVLAGRGAMAADLLTRKTTLWVHATSLGGVESTFERRRRWKTEPATIPDGPGPAQSSASRTSRTCGPTCSALAPCDRRPGRPDPPGGAAPFRAAVAAQSVSALVSRAMKASIISGAVIRPATTASTCSAIGASTPVRSASASSDEHDFAPSAT